MVGFKASTEGKLVKEKEKITCFITQEKHKNIT